MRTSDFSSNKSCFEGLSRECVLRIPMRVVSRECVLRIPMRVVKGD